MKRILFFVLLIASGILGATQARAQGTIIHLDIDTLINFPDSAFNGQIYSDPIVVRNTGNTPYQGTLQIAVKVDTNYAFIYFNQNLITILPGDTVQLVPSPGFTFDSALFRTGNNVVVVWPYSTQAITVDTLIKNVYFYANPSIGVGEVSFIKGLKLYPNPANDYLEVESKEIKLEGVRILESNGRLVRQELWYAGEKQRISIAELLAGCYLLEVTSYQHKKTMLKFIKTE
ncbi:hypothetical protein BH11BAC2_BH11BAC2_17310 [soil metagenome]